MRAIKNKPSNYGRRFEKISMYKKKLNTPKITRRGGTKL